MQRYFSKEKKDNFLYLSNEDFYHIFTVMRMSINDLIEVVYDEQLYIGKISSHDRVEIVELIDEKEVKTKISLIIPILKEQKMDFILQKATELGVSEIIPYNAVRSVIKINGKEKKKSERWQKICKEASEQSKRLTVPTVCDILSLKDIVSLDGEKYICSTLEKERLLKNVFPLNDNGSIFFIFGPEGGFDSKEENFLIENGFLPISLGDNILRAETVPLYLMSIINFNCNI